MRIDYCEEKALTACLAHKMSLEEIMDKQTQILDAAKGAAAENAQGVGIWSNLGDMPHASFRALSRSSQKYAAISSPPRSITMGQDQFLPTAISLSSQGFSDSLLQSKFAIVRLEVNHIYPLMLAPTKSQQGSEDLNTI